MSLTVLATIGHALATQGLHASHHEQGPSGPLELILMYGQLPLFAAYLVMGWGELRQRWPTIAAPLALWSLTLACAALT
jgi:hypothetical protein